MPNTPLDAPAYVAGQIAERVPDLRPRLDAVAHQLPAVVGQAHWSGDDVPGLSPVVNQAANDFIDLLYDVSCGRGRPALKAARSLFELLVTALDIRLADENAARYLEHRWIVSQVVASLVFESEALQGNERRSHDHARRKMRRDSQAAVDAAIERYGASFRRSWTQEPLKDRADRHGLANEYEFYRVGSAALHAAAGGTLGLEREIDGRRVHRTGSALAVCPLALLMACRFMDRLLASIEDLIDDAFLAELRDAIESLIEIWPEYRRSVLALDEELWPQVASPNQIAVLAIGRVGIRQWYVFDPDRALIRRAKPPSLTTGEQAFIDQTVSAVEKMPERDDIVSVAVEEVRGVPVDGALWMPADRILNHSDLLQWGRN